MPEICHGQPCPEAQRIYDSRAQLTAKIKQLRAVVRNTSVLPESAPTDPSDPDTIKLGQAFIDLGALLEDLGMIEQDISVCASCPGREVGCRLGSG